MSVDPFPAPRPDPVETAAAAWLARRDRGLTPREQDRYLEWLRADPRHAPAVARLEKTWGALDALTEWRPSHSPRPNADLLAPPRRPWWRGHFPLLITALAASLVLGIFLRPRLQRDRGPAPVAAHTVHVIPGPERLTLADGSVVELNRGGKIETEFTPALRRVRLVHGEAHFAVAKNPARPFVVDAGAVAVRAVGTAFDVRRADASVEVLVTEGKVQLEPPAAATAVAAEPTALVAGQHASVASAGDATPVIRTLSPAEIERALGWQGVRLEFAELPLAEVVAEFNLRNRQQVVIGDPAVAGVLVGGNFRADNVEGFVRLLSLSFGVAAERRDDQTIVLRLAK